MDLQSWWGKFTAQTFILLVLLLMNTFNGWSVSVQQKHKSIHVSLSPHLTEINSFVSAIELLHH